MSINHTISQGDQMQIQQTIITTQSMGMARIQVLNFFEKNGYQLTSLDPNILTLERTLAAETSSEQDFSPVTARVALFAQEEGTRLLVNWLFLGETSSPSSKQACQSEMDGLVAAVQGDLIENAPAPVPTNRQVQQPQHDPLEMIMLRVEAQFKAGASWFFWIAALSVINSIIFRLGGNLNFIFGLGLTQVIDAIDISIVDNALYPNANTVHILSMVLILLISGLFALFGLLAHKKIKWIYVIGMAFYLLDGLILLMFQDFISAAFHAYVLFGLWRGYKALGALLNMEKTDKQA
jgi:hypothetical protein